MARIPQITSKSDVRPEHGAIFDAIAESRGRVGGPFSVLLNSPEVAGRTAHLGSYIRFESTLSAADRELAIITTSREFDCGYEWAAHARLAAEAGVRQEAIDLIAGGGALDALTEGEALIVRYGRELFRDHRVSEDTFDAAKARYGEQGVTELTATMGYYAMLACALNAFEVAPPSGAPELP
jgi:4-carboxymuconolactone decarboxylase